MNEKIRLFRDPLDPRELSFGLSQPHTQPSTTSGTGIPVEEMNNIEREWAGLCAGGTSEQNLDVEPKKLARANDPETSKAAAKMVKSFAPTIHALIISALKNGPGTFYDIAEWLVIEPSTIWRRLNELERKNLIETTGEERRGPTGRLCRVWRLV